MTTTTLSETIAKAILATVEKDRCCNLGNIAETVFRELAVAEARKESKSADYVSFDFANIAVELHKSIGAERGLGIPSDRLRAAYDAMERQLRARGLL